MKAIFLTLNFFFLINNIFCQDYCLDWATQIGSVEDIYSNEIITDKHLNTYITGAFRGYENFGGVVLESNGTADIFIAKYDKDGQLLWANRAGGGTNWYEAGQSICIDKKGNCYLSGYFKGRGKFNNKTIQSYDDSYDAFICKYSESGDILWVNKIGGDLDEGGSQIELDSEGNVVFAGVFSSDKVWLDNHVYIDGIKRDALIMAKYNDQGKLIWHKKLYESSGVKSFCFDLDIHDNIYAAGSFWLYAYFENDTIKSEIYIDKFISKFNKEGNRHWLKQIGGSISIICSSIYLDHIGNIYTSGHFHDTIYFDDKSLVSKGESDIYLAKHDTSGNVNWVTSAGDDNLDESFDLAYSLTDEIFLIGRFEDSIQFNNQLLHSNGLIDILVSRFDSSGVHLSSLGYGGDSDSYFDDRGTGIDINIQNGLSITGSFNGTMDFISDSLISNGQQNIYIAKWDICQTDTTFYQGAEIQIFPNPTNGKVNIKLPQDHENIRLRIVNLIGQTVLDKKFDNRHFSFELEVPNGCYIFLFSNELNQNTYFKIIKN